MAILPTWGGKGTASASLAPGSIPASALEDGVVPTSVRRGALFTGGAERGSVSRTLTGASGEIQFTYKQDPGHGVAELDIAGSTAATRQLIRTTGTGFKVWAAVPTTPTTITLTNDELSVEADYAFTFSSTAWSFTRNGVVVGSGAGAFTIGTSAHTFFIGNSGVAATKGTLYDVRLIDPASSANTAYFPLDGDFQNTEPGSTVADATLTGDVDWVTVLGDSGKPMLAMPYQGVPTNVRKGASTLGNWVGSYSWGPSTTTFQMEFTLGVHALAGHFVLGRSLAGRAHIGVGAAGTLSVFVDGTTMVSFPGACIADGKPRKYRVGFAPGVQTLLVDGVELPATAMATGFTHATGVTANFISENAGDFVLYDVRLIDPASSANTAYFPLDDDLLQSSVFRNDHPGSTVADATIVGFVQSAAVLSSDGGRALPVGRMVYLHQGRRQSAQAISGTTFVLNIDTVDLNESGGLAISSADIFTAPVAGIAKASFSLVFDVNADVQDVANMQIYLGGGVKGAALIELGARAEVASGVVSAAGLMAAGTTIQLLIVSVEATTSLSVLSASVSIEFYPTAP